MLVMSLLLVFFLRTIHKARYGIMMMRVEIPIIIIPPLLLEKPTIKWYTPPRIPRRVETTIPKIDKNDENPIKFNPKPNFVNLILSTEDLSISILFASSVMPVSGLSPPLPPWPPAGWANYILSHYEIHDIAFAMSRSSSFSADPLVWVAFTFNV